MKLQLTGASGMVRKHLVEHPVTAEQNSGISQTIILFREEQNLG